MRSQPFQSFSQTLKFHKAPADIFGDLKSAAYFGSTVSEQRKGQNSLTESPCRIDLHLWKKNFFITFRKLLCGSIKPLVEINALAFNHLSTSNNLPHQTLNLKTRINVLCSDEPKMHVTAHRPLTGPNCFCNLISINLWLDEH